MPEFDQSTKDLISGMLLMALLLAIIAVGIRVVAVFRRSLLGEEEDPEAELAESIEEAYEAGEINSDEYRQIQEALDRSSTPPLTRTPRGPVGGESADADPEQQGDDNPHAQEDAQEPESGRAQ